MTKWRLEVSLRLFLQGLGLGPTKTTLTQMGTFRPPGWQRLDTSLTTCFFQNSLPRVLWPEGCHTCDFRERQPLKSTQMMALIEMTIGSSGIFLVVTWQSFGIQCQRRLDGHDSFYSLFLAASIFLLLCLFRHHRSQGSNSDGCAQRWPAAKGALAPAYLCVAIGSPTQGYAGWSDQYWRNLELFLPLPLPLSLRLDSELFAMGSAQFINIVT